MSNIRKPWKFVLIILAILVLDAIIAILWGGSYWKFFSALVVGEALMGTVLFIPWAYEEFQSIRGKK